MGGRQKVARHAYAQRVLGAAPFTSLNQQTGRQRAVDFREGIDFGLAIGPAGAGKQAHIVRQRLLQIQAKAMLAFGAIAGGIQVGHCPGLRRLAQGVAVAAHHRMIAKRQRAQLAGLASQCVGVGNFDLIAIVLEDAVVQRLAIGLLGLDEAAKAQLPVIMKPLNDRAPGIATRIGCVVKRPLRHQRPVHELGARVVVVAVVVKEVDDRHIAHREHRAALVHHASQLASI